MAVKYQCPKCEKRYVEWGAKKLDFNCPDCEDEKLVLPGLGDGKSARPSLKRKKKASKKKKAVAKKSTAKAAAAKPKATPAKTKAGKAAGKAPAAGGKDPGGKDDGKNGDLTDVQPKKKASS